MPRTEVCELVGNYKSNPFMNSIVSKIKEAYPGAIHNCPYNVNIFNTTIILFILKLINE